MPGPSPKTLALPDHWAQLPRVNCVHTKYCWATPRFLISHPGPPTPSPETQAFIQITGPTLLPQSCGWLLPSAQPAEPHPTSRADARPGHPSLHSPSPLVSGLTPRPLLGPGSGLAVPGLPTLCPDRGTRHPSLWDPNIQYLAGCSPSPTTPAPASSPRPWVGKAQKGGEEKISDFRFKEAWEGRGEGQDNGLGWTIQVPRGGSSNPKQVLNP